MFHPHYSLRPDQIRRAQGNSIASRSRFYRHQSQTVEALQVVASAMSLAHLKAHPGEFNLVTDRRCKDVKASSANYPHDEIKRVSYLAELNARKEFEAQCWNTARIAGYKGSNFKEAKIAAWRFLDGIVTEVSRA